MENHNIQSLLDILQVARPNFKAKFSNSRKKKKTERGNISSRAASPPTTWPPPQARPVRSLIDCRGFVKYLPPNSDFFFFSKKWSSDEGKMIKSSSENTCMGDEAMSEFIRTSAHYCWSNVALISTSVSLSCHLNPELPENLTSENVHVSPLWAWNEHIKNRSINYFYWVKTLT